MGANRATWILVILAVVIANRVPSVQLLVGPGSA